MTPLKIFYFELGQLWGLVLGVCLICLGLAMIDDLNRPLRWLWFGIAGILLITSVVCGLWLRWYRLRMRRSRWMSV
jgi:hypothetical protein